MAYTTIDDPSAHFQMKSYAGNGSSQSVTFDGNSNMQPDFLWTKSRTDNSDPIMRDTSRGIANRLLVHANDAEGGATGSTSMDSDGFSLDSTGTVNASGQTYIGWGWKANGGTTTTISAGGDVGRETVSQVNTTAGFNICTYSGSGSQSSFGHSLGAKPHWIIIKNRSQADDWFVWVEGMNNNQGLEINTNDAVGTTNGYMGNEAPTSVFVGLGDGHNTNASSENYAAYLWTSIQGYSDFGIYEGTGAADGPFVYTGFKPSWLMIKEIGNANEWRLFDHKRSPFNQVSIHFEVDTNGQETDGGTSHNGYDFLSNGFKIKTDNAGNNRDGGNYAYMCFAESPFVSSEGVPTTAR